MNPQTSASVALTNHALCYWHSLEFFNNFDLEGTVKRARDSGRPEYYLSRGADEDKHWDQFSDRRRNVYLAIFDVGQATKLVTDYVSGTEYSELVRLRDEEMAPEGPTCFAKLPLTCDGLPVFKELSLSTLPWAVGLVCQGQLERLSAEDFEQAVADLKEQMESAWSCLEERLCTPDFLTQLVDILLHWAAAPLTLSSTAWIDVVGKPPKDKVKSDSTAPEASAEDEQSDEAPLVADELPILNSFYFHDLQFAKTALQQSPAVNPLWAYLQADGPSKLDLETPEGEAHILDSLTPNKFNAGRWPSEPYLLQSLMQQFALNKLRALPVGGLLSVNGPPGTGKTTLLRDLIADLVIQRADELAKLAKPVDGVSTKTETVTFGNASSRAIPALIPALTGFEIIVCSSNNGAVENLSLELPQLDGVAKEYHQTLQHFRQVATKYAGTQKNLAWKAPDKPVWGLVSAALGKSANRKRFGDIFGYRAVTPDEKPADRFLPKTKVKHSAWEAQGVMNIWRFRENAGKSLPSFEQAKLRFRAARKKYAEYLSDLDTLRQQWLKLLEQWKNAQAQVQEIPELNADSNCSVLISDLDIQLGVLQRQVERLEAKLGPALIRWLLKWFRKVQYRQWLAAKEKTGSIQDLQATLHVIRRLQQKCGELQLWDGKPLHSHRNHEKTFWQGNQYNQHRNELFVAAMELHQAFVLEAATPETFFAMSDLLSKRPTGGSVLAIWQWLFMLTPVVSSTFASVRNQFRGVGAGSFGWVIVDEAGQAVPQAAVGAILRSKRTVVVGDPLQIEPVVTMPSKLIDKLGEYWLKDQVQHYAAHQHSVQTLADRAHPFGVRHPHQTEKFIGIPLVMHRRCDNPMFDIANAIAYRNRMKHAKSGKISAHPVLGASAWWDVSGSAGEGKYVPEHGEKVFEALISLYLAEIKDGRTALPNAYVITPFREVKQGLTQLLLDQKKWRARLADHGVGLPSNLAGWHTNIGTVHTFQGKEADIVFFVLGCDDARQGAITWASSIPNLLNVALTRAKKHCYIVGDKALWGCQKHFDVAAAQLPTGDISRHTGTAI